METPVGVVPEPGDLDLTGLDADDTARAARALTVDPAEWTAELPTIHEHFASFGDKLPDALRDQLAALEARLGA